MRAKHANALFIFVWLLLALFCYFNSFDDPSSIFFDEARAFDERFSLTRTADAEHLLEVLTYGPPTPKVEKPAGSRPFLCIGIPSVARNTISFLPQTIATLVDTLTPEERSSIHIVTLLADRDPTHHPAFGAPWLERMVDEALIYTVGNGSLTPKKLDSVTRAIPFDVRGKGRGTERVENMRLDHSVLVDTCRANGARYFALVEDDIVASRDWFPRFKSGLETVEARTAEPGAQDWLYFRLFYSELFMGWNSEEWLEYSKVIFELYVGALALFLILRKTCPTASFPFGTASKHSHSRYGARHNAAWMAALVFGLWLPATIVLYFAAGRVSTHRMSQSLSIWPKSGVREMPQYGCCAQGLVFPDRHLDKFHSLLVNPPFDFPGDMKLEDLARDQGLTKWALDPSVFQHVGLKESSDGTQRKEVWNFSFERQHDK
ncbi:hypothetical protein ACHAQA_009739 [Verticillium albo-atrum]